MSQRKIELLLEELCGDLGFCLSPDARTRLIHEPPACVEKFVDAVIRAEGLDLVTGVPASLRRDMRRRVARLFEAGVMEAYHDYDAYAYAVLIFVCSDCKSAIEPPEWYRDCDDAYCRYIARKAEADGWFIACDERMTCYCPDCRLKRQL